MLNAIRAHPTPTHQSDDAKHVNQNKLKPQQASHQRALPVKRVRYAHMAKLSIYAKNAVANPDAATGGREASARLAQRNSKLVQDQKCLYKQRFIFGIEFQLKIWVYI